MSINAEAKIVWLNIDDYIAIKLIVTLVLLCWKCILCCHSNSCWIEVEEKFSTMKILYGCHVVLSARASDVGETASVDGEN